MLVLLGQPLVPLVLLVLAMYLIWALQPEHVAAEVLVQRSHPPAHPPRTTLPCAEQLAQFPARLPACPPPLPACSGVRAYVGHRMPHIVFLVTSGRGALQLPEGTPKGYQVGRRGAHRRVLHLLHPLHSVSNAGCATRAGSPEIWTGQGAGRRGDCHRQGGGCRHGGLMHCERGRCPQEEEDE